MNQFFLNRLTALFLCTLLLFMACSSGRKVEAERLPIVDSDTLLFCDFEDSLRVAAVSSGFLAYSTTAKDYQNQFLPIWYSASHANPIYGVPENQIGYQNAHSGNAYISLMTRDYLQSQRMILSFELNSQLQKDSIYSIQFYVSLADKYDSCDGLFDVAFSSEQINTLNTNKACRELQTKFSRENPGLYCNKQDWIKVDFLYKAFGDEQFMFIGNLNNEQFQTEDVHVIYYLDDVLVRKVGG